MPTGRGVRCCFASAMDATWAPAISNGAAATAGRKAPRTPNITASIRFDSFVLAGLNTALGNWGAPMFKKPHCPVIAIEEHYWDDELEKTFTGGEAGRPGEQYNRLKDLGALRLKE